MNNLVTKVLHEISANDLADRFYKNIHLPLPAINKVELYLSFYGNDNCAHCITNSGPHRSEVMSPDTALKSIKNIAEYNILTVLEKVLGKGEYRFARPQKCIEFDRVKHPPKRLNDRLIQDYADCIMGKGFCSEWQNQESFIYKLNFGRPSIRLSGGEFYSWPHELNGKKVSEDERLFFQKELLDNIRKYLPEYDIWILTNGRFAEDSEHADKVLQAWGADKNICNNGSRTRISVSVDVFHSPPCKSTTVQMLKRLWAAAKNNNLGAPYIYGVSNRKIFLAGRALLNFGSGEITDKLVRKNSFFSPDVSDCLIADPNNLVESNGCDELKGFSCQTPKGVIIANNIVINYNGHLAYCCVCVGDYGDFANAPRQALTQIVKDPISFLLRNGKSAAQFLNTAVNLDSSIQVFGETEYEKTTGSTCYQLLSGKRFMGGGKLL